MEPDAKSKSNIRIGTIYGVPILVLVTLIFVLNTTNPLQTGPAGILLVFGLLYAAISTIAFALLHAVSLLFELFGIKRLHISRSTYYVTSIITLWPIFILALNTLGRLEVTEVVLVTLLIVLGCFYILRRMGVTPRI